MFIVDVEDHSPTGIQDRRPQLGMRNVPMNTTIRTHNCRIGDDDNNGRLLPTAWREFVNAGDVVVFHRLEDVEAEAEVARCFPEELAGEVVRHARSYFLLLCVL